MEQVGADLLAELTPAQQEAVMHVDGPLLILAAAGSGKTRVITRRVAWLLQQGVRAGNILAITFTNKAAGEMRERVEALVPGNRVMIRTFHSLGATLLRQYADRLHIDPKFTIYDTDDRNKILKALLDSARVDTRLTPDRVGAVISKAKNKLLTPDRYSAEAGDFVSTAVAAVYAQYHERLRNSNAVDFDDLLYLPAIALRTDPELRAELDARFKYVLIDEYQDTNNAQYEFAHRLSIDYRNLCVVGDPDQAIYRWRGSDIGIILNFEHDYPDAKVVLLGQNFRSTKAILLAAGGLIEHNRQRKKKPLVTDNPAGEPVSVLQFDTGLDEADQIAARIKQAVNAGLHSYRDVAVFVRLNALTRTLESAFVTHGIPFQIVRGLAFFERKETKDVLAYLRLLVNPRDNLSFSRAVGEPPRGVGKVSLEHLLSFADSHQLSLLEACGRVDDIAAIKGKAAAGLKSFRAILTELRGTLELQPHEVIEAVIDRAGLRATLQQSTDPEDQDRLANVEEMISAARQFAEANPQANLADFLEKITLASDVDNWNADQDHVSIMTLHAAKGLEFPVVYILAVEQGILPMERSMHDPEDTEEERRLLFVGMTRAKKHLHLTHAKLRDFRGQTLYAIQSGFLNELPKEAIHKELCSRHAGRKIAADHFRGGNPHATSAWKETGVSATTVAGDVELSDGQIVQHDSYGIGQVTQINGFGALRKIRIRFAVHGEKVFVADKVKLKVVPKR